MQHNSISHIKEPINYVKHTLSNKVDIWNDLEFNLKNIKSCNIFKNMIKKQFLQIFQISHN